MICPGLKEEAATPFPSTFYVVSSAASRSWCHFSLSFRIFCFRGLPAPSFVAFDGRRGSRHRLGLCRGVEVDSDSVAVRLVSSWKMLLGISLEIQCLSSCWKLWKNQGEFLDSNRRGKTNPSTKLLWRRGVGGGET